MSMADDGLWPTGLPASGLLHLRDPSGGVLPLQASSRPLGCRESCKSAKVMVVGKRPRFLQCQQVLFPAMLGPAKYEPYAILQACHMHAMRLHSKPPAQLPFEIFQTFLLD